jgi:release factor glutamine methyltransferase
MGTARVIGAELARAVERLTDAGCETPRVDAEHLLAHVLRTARSGLYADGTRVLSEEETAAFERLVARREGREPVAYVLGEWGFRRLTVRVDRRVLVPRPETEVVVERCLALIRDRPEPLVLDVGTGSGAIALAVADEHPSAHVTGFEVSADALALARENVELTGLGIELMRGDLFDGLPSGPWDAVVSNPPYVRPEEVESLSTEVREFEPRAALVGEGATEAVADAARKVLRPGGALVLESADGEAARIASLLRDLGYRDIRVTPDLTGRDRVVEGLLGK